MHADIDKKKIPEEVMSVLATLQSNGYPSYLVGGCVRDLVLGNPPKDYDICTGAQPEQVKRLFARVVETGIKYGTVTVLAKGRPIEVTTFRKDGQYTDGRRPESVEFGTDVKEDVKRRDFTVNGLLYDGENLIDYVNGLADIEAEVIRAIGDPKQRIAEDALRMMRAIRLSCQLNFGLENKTREAIEKNAALIANVAPERVKDELVRIILSEYPGRGIRLLIETGLLSYWISELVECFEFSRRYPGQCKVFDHTLKVLDSVPNNLTVRLAALLHDVAKPKTFSLSPDGRACFAEHHLVGADMARVILHRLKFDNKTIKNVCLLIEKHAHRCEFGNSGSVRELIVKVGETNIEHLVNLQAANILSSSPPYDFKYIDWLREETERIINDNEPLYIKDLAINGFDLEDMGIEHAQMGRIFKQLMECVLRDPRLNTREQLTEIVMDLIEAKESET